MRPSLYAAMAFPGRIWHKKLQINRRINQWGGDGKRLKMYKKTNLKCLHLTLPMKVCTVPGVQVLTRRSICESGSVPAHVSQWHAHIRTYILKNRALRLVKGLRCHQVRASGNFRYTNQVGWAYTASYQKIITSWLGVFFVRKWTEVVV